jgi:hypothetical protein
MKKGERKGRGIPENALGEGHDCKMQIGMQQPLECEKCRSMLHFAGGTAGDGNRPRTVYNQYDGQV